MKKSHIILLSIILFPSLLYLFFEMTQANFKKMAYYGPKTVNKKGDTVYYTVPNYYFNINCSSSSVDSTFDEQGKLLSIAGKPNANTFLIDTINFPVYIILFLKDSLQKDGYKLNGLYDYVQYKSSELKDIPMFFVSEIGSALACGMENKELRGTFDSLRINLTSFHPLLSINEFAEQNYFKNKPYYVFNYFAVLVDKQRHIRGYYDPNQNSEIKRMIQEFKHLKTKDEYANTLSKNEIEKK